VIVRHYSLSEADRSLLFARIRRIARQRGLILLLSGTPEQARQWQADGVYSAPNGRRQPRLLFAATAHDLNEIRKAERCGADLVLLSPLFPTRSHPGASALGIGKFAQLLHATRLPVIALGGVRARHRNMIEQIGAYGWAGIDAFIPKAMRIRT
jgi:thiamine-phosphate pyrophosphorylase